MHSLRGSYAARERLHHMHEQWNGERDRAEQEGPVWIERHRSIGGKPPSIEVGATCGLVIDDLHSIEHHRGVQARHGRVLQHKGSSLRIAPEQDLPCGGGGLSWGEDHAEDRRVIQRDLELSTGVLSSKVERSLCAASHGLTIGEGGSIHERYEEDGARGLLDDSGVLWGYTRALQDHVAVRGASNENRLLAQPRDHRAAS